MFFLAEILQDANFEYEECSFFGSEIKFSSIGLFLMVGSVGSDKGMLKVIHLF